MESNIERVKIIPLDGCIKISVRYKNGHRSGDGTFSRAGNIANYLKLKYGVKHITFSHFGMHWVAVYIPKNRVDVAVAFKMEFG